MTLADFDVVRILEEILPRRFGGGPSDYQLVEDLANDGGPRLRLLVHPSVAAVDPAVVSHVFLEALGSGSGTRQVMENDKAGRRELYKQLRLPPDASIKK